MKAHALKIILGLLVLSAMSQARLFAQSGNDNPYGVAGVFNGQVTTGCSYDPYTGDAKRTVTDLVVAGSVGAYPLQFTRIGNTRGTGVWYFQDGGNWRHNYAWSIDEVSRTPGQDQQGRPTSFLVHYPDGRDVDFQPSKNGDPYYRGLSGVRERLKIDWNNWMFYLLLPDGGQVTFSVARTVDRNSKGKPVQVNYNFTLQSIIDPYRLATTITQQPDGSISQITEPGGNRWIKLVYGYYNDYGINYTVLDHIQASDGRNVYYHYSNWRSPGNGSNFIVLSSVSYFSNPNPDLTATYTYQPDNVNPGGGQGYDANPPLLSTCDDPMYTGPMRRIAYKFAGKNAYGYNSPSGQIQSENYYDSQTVGAAVSTLTMSTTGSSPNFTYIRTETRGDGPTRTFSYSGALLRSWTDFRGVGASFGYDANNFVNSFRDFNGHTTNYTRDSYTGVITSVTYPATPEDTTPSTTQRGVVTYTYGSPSCPDANNRDANNAYYVCSATDEAGHTTFYYRDQNKRVTQINYPDGGTEGFSYNYFGEVINHRLTTGGLETYTYDGRGLLKEYRDAYHLSTQDPQNPSVPANATPSFAYGYDSLDRLSAVTDALGSGPGDPTHTTNYNYNSRNQVTIITHPVDPGSVGATPGKHYTVVNDYNMADGTLKSATDELGHITKFFYDDYKRLTSVTDPLIHTTTYVYAQDWAHPYLQTTSNVKGTWSPMGKPTHFAYDPDWHRSILREAAGTADDAWTTYGYDNNGNLTSVFSPKEQSGQPFYGQSTVITYDERNRVFRVTDPLQNVTSRTYDAWGRAATITRANGQLTRFNGYDPMNRLLSKTVSQSPSPDAWTGYGWYTSGLLGGMQDPHLVEIRSGDSYGWVYDLMGRKTEAIYPLVSGSVRRQETWHYDTAGRLDKFTNRAGNTETFAYDSLNRLTSTSWDDGVTPGVTIKYDVANRPVSVANTNATVTWTYFDDDRVNTETLTALSAPARTVTYQYNADGLRSNIWYPGPSPAPAFSYNYTSRNQLDNISDGVPMQWVKYLYDVDGNRQHRKLHNATTDTMYGAADVLDRIPWISTAFTSGGTANFSYGFDAVSRLRFEQRTGGPADGYTYDQADQIIGFNRSGTLQSNGTVAGGAEVMSLSFDANGNRVSTTDNNVTKNYLVDILNQYTQDAAGTPTYTSNGNMASTGDGWVYTYDAQNRLTNVDSSNTHVIYYYDPLNRQVARDEPGGRTYSVWDGWSLIQEYNGSGTLLNNYLQGAGMDEIVARFGANNANRLWYYQDGRGNTSHVADDSGALVETYTYDLGGKPFYSTAAGKTWPNNRFLYNGRDYSLFTGLYDFRNRFYDPWSSRFIQSDPIGFAGGNHLYRFVGNSAVNGSDPLGSFMVRINGAAPMDVPSFENLGYDLTSYDVAWISGGGGSGSGGSGGGKSLGLVDAERVVVTGSEIPNPEIPMSLATAVSGIGAIIPGPGRTYFKGYEVERPGGPSWVDTLPTVDPRRVIVRAPAPYDLFPVGAVIVGPLGNLWNFGWQLYQNGEPLSGPGWANREKVVWQSDTVRGVINSGGEPPVPLDSHGILHDKSGFTSIPQSATINTTYGTSNTIYYNGEPVGWASSIMHDNWRVNGEFHIYEYAY